MGKVIAGLFDLDNERWRFCFAFRHLLIKWTTQTSWKRRSDVDCRGWVVICDEGKSHTWHVVSQSHSLWFDSWDQSSQTTRGLEKERRVKANLLTETCRWKLEECGGGGVHRRIKINEWLRFPATPGQDVLRHWNAATEAVRRRQRSRWVDEQRQPVRDGVVPVGDERYAVVRDGVVRVVRSTVVVGGVCGGGRCRRCRGCWPHAEHALLVRVRWARLEHVAHQLDGRNER